MESVAALLALVLTAIAFAPGATHVLELPNKLAMHQEEYLLVQRLYRGWRFLGIVVVAALAANLWYAMIARGSSEAPAVVAFVAVLATQIVFWVFTFPVKLRLREGSRQPVEDWEKLRDRWEISQAASALLNFVALACLAVAVLLR